MHVHKIHAGNLMEGGMADAETLAAQEVAKLEKKLEEFVTQYADSGITMTTAVYSGEPYLEIIRAADKTGADMIIMGTHGRTGVAYLVIGSVAENVLRHARVPVMSIRCRP
jgi:nucleotide-binding universal stress UspA family protein